MSLCIVAFFLMSPCTASLFQTHRHRPRLSPTTKVWFPPHISRFTSIIATPSGCKRLTYGSKKVPRSSRNMQTLVSKVRFWNVWIFWIYQNLFRRIMNGPRPRSLDRLGADSNWLRREVYRTLIGSKSLMATWLKNHSQVLRPTAVCRCVCVCVCVMYRPVRKSGWSQQKETSVAKNDKITWASKSHLFAAGSSSTSRIAFNATALSIKSCVKEWCHWQVGKFTPSLKHKEKKHRGKSKPRLCDGSCSCQPLNPREQ